ncbi:hypothetical protein [Methanocella sp. MCL-LM]|uniref:hypothetical protein n=1 Tax=Methanocella sp. MCL-LM TaxID=3412035 RepID=UPI003C71AC91
MQQATSVPLAQNNSTLELLLNINTYQQSPFLPDRLADNYMTIASVIISLFAFVIVIYQIRQTKRAIALTQISLDMTKQSIELNQKTMDVAKEEINSRLRPFLGFSVPHVQLEKNKTIIVNEITNYGNYPATNARIRAKQDTSKIDVTLQLEDDTPYVIIMPNQNHKGQMVVNTNLDMVINESNEYYLLLSVSYHNDRTNKTHITNTLFKYNLRDKFVMIDSFVT